MNWLQQELFVQMNKEERESDEKILVISFAP
jgi:hypothetical protein